jgi:hypothetical protein
MVLSIILTAVKMMESIIKDAAPLVSTTKKGVFGIEKVLFAAKSTVKTLLSVVFMSSTTVKKLVTTVKATQSRVKMKTPRIS